MNIEALVNDIRNAGLELWLDNGSLKLRGPQAALSPELVGQLRTFKPMVIDWLNQNGEQGQPLTSAQASLWTLYQLDPTAADYNVAYAIELMQDINIDALDRAYARLIERHQSLRMAFANRHEGACQQPATGRRLTVRVIESSEAALPTDMQQAIDEPFQLESGQTNRLLVLKVDNRARLLILALHHIVADFISVEILLSELRALYAAACDGSEARLQKPDRTLADILEMERTYLASDRAESDWQFWRQSLNGELPILDLQPHRPNGIAAELGGHTDRIIWSTSFSSQIRAAAANHGVTVYNFLLASYYLLLAKCTGKRDLIVGMPSTDRSDSGVGNTIGHFINSLPIRAQYEGTLSFSNWLKIVQSRVLEAIEHRDFPFPLMVQRLAPERDTNHSPVFQVLFNWNQRQRRDGDSADLAAPDVFGATLHATSNGVSGSICDLSLTVADQGDTFQCSWNFSERLYAQAFMAEIEASYQHVVLQAVQQPHLALDEFSLCPLEQGPDAFRIAPPKADPELPHVPMYTRFVEQARRRPDAIAIIAGTTQVTYAELEAQSRRIATHLVALGAGPETCVGLMLPRTANTIAAIMGVLRAGAAYLPLDPNYPLARLQQIVASAHPSLIIEDGRGESGLDIDTPRLQLDALLATPPEAGIANAIDPPLTADHFAYLIYTSGSTGVPKGAALTHGNGQALIEWALSEFDERSRACVLGSTSISFDLSIMEIFAALSGGTTLLLVENIMVRPEPAQFDAISMIVSIPTLIESLAKQDGLPPNTRSILLAGEPLPRRTTDLLHQLLPTVDVHNLYGPTEDTTYDVGKLLPRGGRDLPAIGKPLPFRYACVLDAAMRPVPNGVCGEIYLGGAGLARGYYGRPDLTAERFLPDPFPSVPGARIYRSGDIGMVSESGELYCFGRADNQVKVRGFRIELAEIELVLSGLPNVREVHVTALPGPDGALRIVAYIAADSEQQDAALLERALGAKLPKHMLPSLYLWLDALPKLPNGKLNRRALPKPETHLAATESAAASDANATGTTSPIEQMVAGIWLDLLAVPTISRGSHFFRLGGHSLLSAQVVARVNRALALQLPGNAVLESPVFADFLNRVEQARRSDLSGADTAAPELIRHDDLPDTLSNAQRRLWLLDRLATTDRHVYNIPLTLELRGELDIDRLAQCLSDLLVRHEVLRSRIIDQTGDPRVEIMPPTPVTLSIEPVSADWQTEALKAVRQPFDLTRGPLFRCRLLQIADQHYALLLIIHHIVSDGYSTGVLVDDLLTTYRQHGGKPLPAPTIRYADYAAWQSQTAAEPRLVAQLDYWRDTLRDAPTLLTLPEDFPRPVVMSHRGDAVTVTFPDSLASDLHKLARQHDSTLFMLLYAAFSILVSRYARQRDLIIGTPFNNRNHVLLEDVVGMFVNTLPVRTQVEPATRFVDHLAAVRRTLLNAYAHADVPFEQIVEALQPERASSHHPLVQVTFALEHLEGTEFSTDGLDWSLLELPEHAAKFDLSLQMRECAGQLSARFTFNTDLYERRRIDAMASHWLQLCQALIDDSRAHLRNLSILSATEQTWLTQTLNPDGSDHGTSAGMIASIAEQATAQPEAIALIDGTQSFSYRDLITEASRVAAGLRARGTVAESRIGVCMPMSGEAVITMLGIMLAGASYVPIDPTTPLQRIASICADADIRLMVTDSAGTVSVPGTTQAVMAHELRNHPTLATWREPAPEQLAYVIFTSGSTGQPKGVAVSYAALQNLVDWHIARYQLTIGTRTTQAAGFGFDAAVWELWPTLVAGGTLLIADADTRVDPVRLSDWLRRERAEICFLPTPLAEALLRTEGVHHLPLRALLTGGDRLTLGAPRDAEFALVNHYGPTENAVVATAHHVTPGQDAPPIGLPITGVRAYVLDASLNPVPAGIAGELYLAGASLARGYVAQPSGTAERFIPDPFARVPGTRMYRTGDLVSRDHSGVLHFRGRADSQVKLRGYRIELDEIRIALERTGDVSVAIVRLHATSSGSQQVAAWIVPRDASRIEGLPKRLRSQLSDQLPDYMVPTAMAVLDRLPLTANGKVDLRALPEPETIDGAGRTTLAARTPQEELLVGLWESLIGYSPIGVTDNFFDVGGHSLLAMQIATKIQEATGRECTVRTLLDHPTIAELAVVLSQADQSRDEALPVLVSKPEQRYEPFPLTPIQQTYLVGRQGIYDLGDIATQAYSEIDVHDIDPASANRAWQKLIARHEMLRMVLTADLQQRILRDVPTYEVVVEDLSELPAQDAAERLLAIRHEMSSALRSGQQWPLFENRLTRLPSGRWRMHTTIDALIADGWSTQLLMREFLDFYFDQDQHHEPLTLSYRDYVLAEQKIQDGDAYARSKDYWTGRVADLPPPPDLPLKTGRQDTASGRFRRRTATLPKVEWQQFQKVARSLGLTPTNLLLAAYARTLAAWSTNARFMLNLTLFNRLPLHAEVNALVGDFTSLTLLEVDASSPEFAHFAQRLQQQLWSDLDHKYFSGVDVLRELARTRGDGKRAVMPVVFTSSLTQSAGTPESTKLADRLRDFVAGDEYGSSQTSQVWIDHVVAETDGQLIMTWESVDELFEPGVLDAMFAFYRDAVQHIAAQNLAGLHRNACVLPEIQQQRRNAANATEAPITDQLLHALVREQATRSPDRIAVIAPEGQWRYREIWNAASTLAAQLRAEGAEPNQLIAVLMHKGWEQIVACLAIQQAGAAYLPIDGNLPAARREQILVSAEVKTVLTQPALLADRTGDDGRRWLAIESSLLQAAEPVAMADVQQPDDLAYVIFTSGSTGTPKGVMIDHRGAVNTILDINRRWQVGTEDRVLALSALSFDLSVYDLFGLLAVGGALVLPGADQGRDPDAWSELMFRHEITIFNAVPALMQLLLETDANRELPPSLRLVMLSGDWIPVDLPARIRRAATHSNFELVSLGGATEASIWSNYHQIVTVDPSWKSIPYGRPLTNQWFHVLDRDLQHCPDWVAGDLYIGGIGLAKGYWRDPAKTAESFIRHPLTNERLYRTGDMGRYRDDGEIEFLGRRDSQVKIQGFRVELGEIESLLDRHPAVSKSTANVFSLGSHGNSIVAYVVPATTGSDATLPGVILDQAERTAFTLSARSIRTDLMRAPRILLRQPESVYAAGGHAPHTAFQDGEAQALGLLLGALVRFPVPGSALGKHYYPSAGSLYPVQAYVAWGDSHPGLPAGVYYYHPLEHTLFRVGDAPAGLPLTISLVAEHAAIAPLYGASAASFCELEAGYVQELLTAHGNAFDWQCQVLDCAVPNDGWLALTTSQRCVLQAEWRQQPRADQPAVPTILSMFARQSFREFHGDAANLEQLPRLLTECVPDGQLFVHEKTAEGGRLSRLGPEGLMLVAELDSDEAPRFEGLNQDIAEQAAFTLLFTGQRESVAADHIAVGQCAQRLMSSAPSRGLGLCPIGSVDARALFAAAGIAETEHVVHVLLGGSIAPQQTEAWTPYHASKPVPTLPQQLRQYLAAHLPAYMVPAHITLLDAIPLSSNGKVDRKALPQPELSQPVARSRKQPSTAMEHTMAQIWCEVLGVSEVGVHDNFFEVGGNSILLIQVHRKLQDALSITLPIVSLFRHSDIASLTEHLKHQASATPASTEDLDDARAQALRQRAALAKKRERTLPKPAPTQNSSNS
ncbi:hypothetical protein C7S18_08000 [Ahniella affigens]|uniref:Carrier domain-containing protein n=1 Tax=Ahniella affigens TaxID=2021234 RepID=A0A2P1PQQ3_9GAMM|nr:non-ribosomal peptide synthetase [Ahniella affigens]AVP97138.1 hypothetical protein C7S18_08000 [Ahniella affigens]